MKFVVFSKSENNLRKSSGVALTVLPMLVILPQSDERNETRTKEQNDDERTNPEQN